MAVFEPYSRITAEPPDVWNTPENTVSWERLERMRLTRLGIPNRFSRHLNKYTQHNSGRYVPQQQASLTFEQSLRAAILPANRKIANLGSLDTEKSNSIAPFYTQGKPTCGFYFSRGTDNKKRDFGIPPSDLVQWRSFVMQH